MIAEIQEKGRGDVNLVNVNCITNNGRSLAA